MTSANVIHGTFTIERTYRASPRRVFDAWADVDTKARWFIGPPDRWTLTRRELDFRVGGSELLEGVFGKDHVTRFSARYHDIVPERRLVYSYDMHGGGKHLSVSLATVVLEPTESGGTRMTFTEQAAFLDGKDGTRSREQGTAAHFDRLTGVLDALDPCEIVSTRVLPAPRERVFEAIAQPEQLARWWGPEGFANTFHAFDFREGGLWRFTMHGPDGTNYPNECRFVGIVPPERVVLEHIEPHHHFVLTMSLSPESTGTRIEWRMRFDTETEAERVRAFVSEANQQNFDRLARVLGVAREG